MRIRAFWRMRQQIAQIKERAKTDSVLQSWIDSIEKSSQGILEQPTVEFIDKLGYDNGMLTVARTAKEKLYKMAFLCQFTRRRQVRCACVEGVRRNLFLAGLAPGTLP